MSQSSIRAGIVGLKPGKSWAAVAHIPALRHLKRFFEVVGVANSTLESSRAAAGALGIPRAFASAADLANSPDIDLVTITTRVAQHYDVVKLALEAGKHVYCEWPLGRTEEEAADLVRIARATGRLAVTGTQARVSPAIVKTAQLVAEGFIGDVVSTSVTAYVGTWGPTITSVPDEHYLRLARNGASLLTIPFGHTMSAVRDVLGDISDVSSVLETRFPQVRVANSAVTVPADAADHIVVAGHLANQAPISMFYAGGVPFNADGFSWEIRGSAGSLRVTGPHGYSQVAKLAITGMGLNDNGSREFQPSVDEFEPLGLVAGNVARMYRRIAADLCDATETAPTFEDALSLHRVLHAVEQSDRSGRRLKVRAPNRRLP